MYRCIRTYTLKKKITVRFYMGSIPSKWNLLNEFRGILTAAVVFSTTEGGAGLSGTAGREARAS